MAGNSKFKIRIKFLLIYKSIALRHEMPMALTLAKQSNTDTRPRCFGYMNEQRLPTVMCGRVTKYILF